MASVSAKWLRLSETTNALDYLEKAVFFLERAEEDKRAWKWIVLCLHSSLYGWAISALTGTDYKRVTYSNKAGKEKLISFGEAIKRCQDQRFMIMTTSSKALTLSDEERESIRLLKSEFRDNFEHFIPKGWSIEIHGFPQMALDVLRIIRFLAIDSGNYILLRPTEERLLKSYVSRGKLLVKHSQLFKESTKVVQHSRGLTSRST